MQERQPKVQEVVTGRMRKKEKSIAGAETWTHLSEKPLTPQHGGVKPQRTRTSHPWHLVTSCFWDRMYLCVWHPQPGWAWVLVCLGGSRPGDSAHTRWDICLRTLWEILASSKVAKLEGCPPCPHPPPQNKCVSSETLRPAKGERQGQQERARNRGK